MVAIPTETVYGLAGLALSEPACRRIFSVKGRPLVDPLIVHVTGIEMARNLAETTPAFIRLAEHFWPGPLTIILRKKPVVPDIVTAGKSTVALRMPRHAATQELLRRTAAPLAAPSANPFGYISPSRAGHVAESFGDRVPYILDGGPCEVGLESTILDISSPDNPTILRPGAVTAEAIGKLLGRPVSIRSSKAAENVPAAAPGTFARHYSPSTPLLLFEQTRRPNPPEDEAVLLLQRPDGTEFSPNVFWLSEDGNLEEVGRSLFAVLRKLDKGSFKAIHCEFPAESPNGLSRALRDRMTRAAAK